MVESISIELLEGIFLPLSLKKSKKSVLAAVICLILGGAAVYAAGEDTAGVPMQPQSLAFCGIRALQEAEPNLTGQDVFVAAVCRSMTYLDGRPQDDYRFNMAHRCLTGGEVGFPDGSQGYYGLSSHATAIGGILIGYDPYAICPETGNFFYKGVCPDASVKVYEFWRFVSLTVFGKMDFQADVLTLSLGDVYEDWWTRGIDRLAEEKGVLVVASAGNGGAAEDQVLYPAAEANVLAVGVLDAEIGPDGKPSLSAFSLPRKGHSSYGPTADQRCKPDLVAPGRALVPVAYDSTDYEAAGDYSSLAAPVVSGTAALLVQKANETAALRQRLGTEGRNCVLKSILMTSARKLPWWHKGQPGTEDDTRTPLDFLQGAGVLDAAAACRLLTEGGSAESGMEKGWDNTVLNADQPEAVYPLQVDHPQGQYLTATVAWNRHYQDSYPFDATAASDLRLEVWAADPNTDEMILLDASDSPVDTVEHVYLPLSSDYHEYELRISFSDPDAAGAGMSEQIGTAWSVGPDTSAGNRWWYDLNDDGQIDETDRIVFFLLEQDRQDILDQPQIPETLKLSDERLELLSQQWSQWKTHLDQWQSKEGETAVAMP